MGSGFEPTWLSLLMILGAVVLIIAAFGVAVYISRVRRRSPQTVETAGAAVPPAVVDDRTLAERMTDPRRGR